MDLTQLANLGEFIGGVAVLVTLIYLALQVRQSARAQQQANELANAEAMQKSVATYSTYRQMRLDEDVSAIWTKALNDEDLTANEAQRLNIVLQELTWSAAASVANNRAVGNFRLADNTARIVAEIVGQSRTMKRVWLPVAHDLSAYDLAEFAEAILSEMDTSEAPS
jgi:hypothetical protein